MVIHVTEVTQPQGHSTSGSHERYKSEDRLRWEADFDGLEKFKEWILNYSIELEGKEELQKFGSLISYAKNGIYTKLEFDTSEVSCCISI